MKHTRLLLASFGGLVLALLVAIRPPHLNRALAAPAATTHRVLADGGTDTSDCTNSQAPCKSIQHTLAQASDGDVVRVAKGLYPATYAGTVIITKSVTLEGGWGALMGGGGLIWQCSSPCDASWTTIDAGLDVGVTTNIGGDERPIGSDVDIDADEAWKTSSCRSSCAIRRQRTCRYRPEGFTESRKPFGSHFAFPASLR